MEKPTTLEAALKTLAEAQKVIRYLQTYIESLEPLRHEVVRLKAKIEDLEERLRVNSSNSSKPPSQDVFRRGKPKEWPSGKKRGGQSGHPGNKRELLPIEEVTMVHIVKPTSCKKCGNVLMGEDVSPYRHQVIDIPQVVAKVDEYQVHELVCSGCKTSTRGKLPTEIPVSNFSPRVQAMVSVLSGGYRLSKRSIVEILSDFFGVKMSLGSVCAMDQATSQALAEPVAEVMNAIKQSPVVYADETSWNKRGETHWLWVAATPSLTGYLIRQSRNTLSAQELLGKHFGGYLVTDRYSSYRFVDMNRRQLCWAHLMRLWTSFSERPGQAKELGETLLYQTRLMFYWWGWLGDGTISVELFDEGMALFKPRFVKLLKDYVERHRTKDKRDKTANQIKKLLTLEPALWTFSYTAGVEPTNNRAEQAVRHPVLLRQSSLGTDSNDGCRFVERILTTVATLRLQKRKILDFVVAACQAALLGTHSSSLLPVAG